jgi:hypothetical protein
MRITICGSMRFAKQMIETKKKLENMGHVAEVATDIQKFLDDPSFTTDNHEENYKHALETDVMRKHFNLIVKSDAIVVLNYTKNGIPGHLGTSCLMEMAIAYHFKKKIFLLHEPPDARKEKSTHEVLIMQPIILDGDLTKIREHA